MFGETAVASGDFGVSGGDAAVELIQSRNASGSEALAIFRAQVDAFRKRLAAIRGYRVVSGAMCLIVPALGLVWIAGTKLHWIPHLPTLVVISVCALLVVGVCRAWRRYYYGICADIYRDSHQANRRFRIEQDAVVVTAPSGAVSSIPWHAISDIIVSKDVLTIYLSPLHGVSLPMAAVEGQDVQGFCAELQRRWSESRTSVAHDGR